MIPGEFDYHRATSAEEAVRLLAEHEGAKLLAGGHSLLPMMKLRFAAPTLLVDIRGIEELGFIRRNGDDVVIGSMTTHADIAAHEIVSTEHGALAEAAASIGDVQIRNRGTIGGSLAHADPAADYAAAALALDAQVEVLGPDGERSIPAADFFVGLLSTSLNQAELITRLRFPAVAGAVGVYEKFAQPASGFAIVGVAAEIGREGNECTTARLAATGIADQPARLFGVEANLIGKGLDNGVIAEASQQADADLPDIRSDMYAAEDYRRHLLRVLVRRAVTRATS